MERESDIEGLIAPVLADLGFGLVRVMLLAKRRRTLQVMAERADGSPVGVDDCVTISRALSALLDAADPIPGAYDLEVSSPGIDRPLVRPVDFERFAGFEAEVVTREPVDGRRRFRGRLLGLRDDDVELRHEGGTFSIPVAAIAEAKLALTAELLAASRAPRM